MILRATSIASLLIGIGLSYSAYASELDADNVILRELIDFQSCDPAFHSFQYKPSTCSSVTGMKVFMTNEGGVCSISAGGMSDRKGIVEYERTLCTGEVIWALKDNSPVAVAYNIQFNSEYSGADDGRWLIRTIANEQQPSCVIHNIGGTGSRNFVDETLRSLTLPFDCDNAVFTDVN